MVEMCSIARVGDMFEKLFYNYNFKPMGRWDITDTNSMKQLGVLSFLLSVSTLLWANFYEGQKCSNPGSKGFYTGNLSKYEQKDANTGSTKSGWACDGADGKTYKGGWSVEKK